MAEIGGNVNAVAPERLGCDGGRREVQLKWLAELEQLIGRRAAKFEENVRI